MHPLSGQVGGVGLLIRLRALSLSAFHGNVALMIGLFLNTHWDALKILKTTFTFLVHSIFKTTDFPLLRSGIIFLDRRTNDMPSRRTLHDLLKITVPVAWSSLPPALWRSITLPPLHYVGAEVFEAPASITAARIERGSTIQTHSNRGSRLLIEFNDLLTIFKFQSRIH